MVLNHLPSPTKPPKQTPIIKFNFRSADREISEGWLEIPEGSHGDSEGFVRWFGGLVGRFGALLGG